MPAEAGALIVAEPSGRYAVQPPLVADCSVLAAMLFDEPMHDDAVRAMSGAELFAPFLIDHELANVAVTKARNGLDDIARLGLANFSHLRITRCAVDIGAQCRLALEHGLSAYDAAYLQLALDLRAPLATFDKQLGTAAQRVLAAHGAGSA